MPAKDSTKSKHLTMDDRIEIQGCLDHGMTFKAIAARIGKDQTTISKEVKKHLAVQPSSVRRLGADGSPVTTPCSLLLKAPFVCNPCKKRHARCSFSKQFYFAKVAQREYRTILVESRTGTPLNEEEFYRADKIISEGIKKGQHLYHIMKTNQLSMSKSTVYRHLKLGYLSVASLDFPRVVKFKQRRLHASAYVPKAVKVGRTHEDFLAYIDQNDISSWVEMDTVIGRIGGKVILTFHFTFCNFMLGFLLENKTSSEVTQKVAQIKADFDSAGIQFADLFPVILTDNGGEFANPRAIENNALGEKESSLFFCDAFKSYQKPKVEKNHTLFRDIVPSGQSFDEFTQQTVNRIFSHVNSVKRKALGGKTPYEMFCFSFGETAASLLGIGSIPGHEVIQSPLLLRHRNTIQ